MYIVIIEPVSSKLKKKLYNICKDANIGLIYYDNNGGFKCE
ncbi:MAG: hypothetical protein ACRCXY_11425 [Fusobacteriaceae bacterium]